MKQFLLIIAFFLGSFSLVKAQNDRENRFEKVQALKIAFITQKLELTTDEAQKFWPVYNEYRSELQTARKENRQEELVLEEKVLNIRKKYKAEFKKVLGTDQRVNQIFVAEKNFRDILRKELMKRRQNNQNDPPVE